jgi:hypothetical protein
MTTSPTATVTFPPHRRVPLRIRLDNGFQGGPLDGAWWPQSRDLQTEAVDLVDHFPHLVGRIARLLFSPPDWNTVHGAHRPRRVQAERGSIKIGSFPSDDTHVMVVKMLSGQRLRLLVIPSDTDPELAGQLMEEAADELNTRSAAQLLGLSPSGQNRTGLKVWDDDGGASL